MTLIDKWVGVGVGVGVGVAIAHTAIARLYVVTSAHARRLIELIGCRVAAS